MILDVPRRRHGKVTRPAADGGCLQSKRPAVTVCIAAICSYRPNELMIVGASDQMLTAGDLQFEPRQSKLYTFTKTIVGLVAGEMHAQIAICDAAARRFRVKAPASVLEAAQVYADAFTAYRRKLAETTFLHPLGLDANSFIDRQMDMRSDVVFDLTSKMQNGVYVNAETIIAGVDGEGPHLYVVTDPGHVQTIDSVAFAAIGSGKRHAEMQFMLSGYTRQVLHHRALLLSLTAKKRAEVSPGIGTRTDMFFLTGAGYGVVPPTMVEQLTSIWRKMETDIADITSAADRAAEVYVEDVISKPPFAKDVEVVVEPRSIETSVD